jgi:hypothetical protein
MSSGKGDLSRLYKTTDACKSWTLLITNPDKDGFWDAIKFISRDHGVVLGDPINGMFIFMVTFDGGAKWEHRPLQGRINGEAAFAASNSSLLITDKCRMFGAGGFGGPWVIGQVPMDIYKDALDALRDEISKTKNPPQDTCQITQVLPKKSHSETSGVFSLAASSDSSDSTIVAVGGDFNRPDDRDGTAWTNAHDDSTENKFEFKAVQTPPHGYRSSVAYDPTTKTWITVGPNGTDISTDHGKNWRPLKPNATDAPDADQNWNALSLPFVVGPKGRIGKLNPTALKP